jgi:poly(beta-D-mannuronate) lyase
MHQGKFELLLCLIAIALFTVVASHLRGETTRVTSIAELQAAIDVASPGDKIVVANGDYQCDRSITIAQSGTEAAPIEISAETVGSVEITGAAGFTFDKPTAHVVVRGFNFTHAAGTVKLAAGTHHCRVTRNVFELKPARQEAYLTVFGDDHEIDHNTFQNKDTEGQMLEIQGPRRRAMAQRTWIHHNYFYNFENSGRNNSSALHIGHSSRSLSTAHSIIEYNLFIRTRGENEGAVCNKSCANIYRFNTFGEGCTELSLRHGNRCQVYGNFFIGTRGGLRFYGDDHKIYGNYFQNNRPAVQIGNGSANVPPAELTSHDRPDRVQFAFNTLIDNHPHVVMRNRNGGLGAADLLFADNIIQGGRAASLRGPLPGVSWTGNVLWKTEDVDIEIPPGGYEASDPQLHRGADGIYRRPGSDKVLDYGEESDLLVESRGSDRDHSISNASSMARPLTPADVGPSAP